jgi:hypothetical protein
MIQSKDVLKKQLGQYFIELDAIQSQMAELLTQKQVCLTVPDAEELQQITGQEVIAVEQLQNLVARRTELLSQARSLGISAENLGDLASQLDESPESSTHTIQQLRHQSQGLHQASYSLWIACQKSLLHYGQLVQLIANGGRRPMISSTGKHHNPGGAILGASI